MAGYNKVIMLGNLTADPKLSYTQNQTAVCDFGLAVTRRYKDREGVQKSNTCFIDVRAWSKHAENIMKYVSKGDLLHVDGYLDFEKWDHDGTTHSRHRLIVDSFQMMPKSSKAAKTE